MTGCLVDGALKCYIVEVERLPIENIYGLVFCTRNQSPLDTHKVFLPSKHATKFKVVSRNFDVEVIDSCDRKRLTLGNDAFRTSSGLNECNVASKVCIDLQCPSQSNASFRYKRDISEERRAIWKSRFWKGDMDEHSNAKNSTLLNRRDGADDVRARDSQGCSTLDPTIRLGKRKRPDPSGQDKKEFLKHRLLGGLQEMVKVVEEWDADLDFNTAKVDELLGEIDAQKKKETLLLEERIELQYKIAAQVKREALLLEERGGLIEKIAVQEKKEALLLEECSKLNDRIAAQEAKEALHSQEREELLHEIGIRRKTKTLLIEERKNLFKRISDLKERETLLQLNATDARKKTQAMHLQGRKILLNTIDVQKKTEVVLLQERSEIINRLSKRIHALKKRERQLLQKCKKSEVKLCNAVDKLHHHRDTRAINILWDVTQKILALTVDVEEFQLSGNETTIPRTESHLEAPSTLPSSWKEAKQIINRAEAAFTKAAKNLKKSQSSVDVMKSCCREGVLDRILGRKQCTSKAEAACMDIPDEQCLQQCEQPQETLRNCLPQERQETQQDLTLEIAYHNAKAEEVSTHSITLPKQSSVGDVINELKTKVALSSPNAELRILSIFYHKIFRTFFPNEEIETITNPFWTLRAEEIPDEEKELGVRDRLIQVQHFFRDPAQKQMATIFGEPFFLVVRENETLAAVKVRLQNKLQVSNDEFSKYKFAFLSLGRPQYLQDDDVVASFFQGRDSCSAWDYSLGLEDSDTANERAHQLTSEQMKVPRKRLIPRRLEASPSSPRELKESCKHTPPSSEKVKGSRVRKKTQRYVSSP